MDAIVERSEEAYALFVDGKRVFYAKLGTDTFESTPEQAEQELREAMVLWGVKCNSCIPPCR